MPPSLHEVNPRRIALIKPSALGDIVHSLPVLGALRQRFPEAHISWIVNRAYAPLLEGHPELDEIIAFDRNATRKGYGLAAISYLRFLANLRKRRFDLVIDLQGLLRTGIMVWASGAHRRVGLRSAREGAALAYTDRIGLAGADALHAVNRYLLVAEALGVKPEEVKFNFPVAPAALQWALQQIGH